MHLQYAFFCMVCFSHNATLALKWTSVSTHAISAFCTTTTSQPSGLPCTVKG